MGSEARTRLGLAGLVGATTLAFGQVFADGGYLGPMALGAALSVGVAVGSRRLGLRPAATIAVSGAAMAWYLLIVFEGGNTVYGVPTGDALAELARSVARAGEMSRSDYAPVPPRPGYVALAVGGMWMATTVAEVATFRLRRPLLASLPFVALFSVLMVVGTGAGGPLLVMSFLGGLFAYWGLESLHRLRSWGRCMSPADEVEPVTARLGRRMAASCVAVALVAPVLLPSLEDGLLSWRSGDARGGSGNASGRAAGRTIDLLVDIKPRLLRQSDMEMFTVRSSRAAYWRIASLAAFDGRTWRPIANPSAPLTPAGVDTIVPAAPRARTLTHTIRVLGLGGRAMPAAVQPADVYVRPQGPRSESDVAFDPETGALHIPEGVADGFTYTVDSLQPDATYGDLRGARIGALPNPDTYTALPPGLLGRVAPIASRWTRGYDRAFDRLVAIQDRLRRFTYSTEVPADSSGDYLVTFLTETRAGYCQQFAAAFAVLARALGYPARVNVGFLPGRTSLEAPTEYLVRGTDAHAWPEVYLDGFGWVAFEPTPRAPLAAAPVYTAPPADPVLSSESILERLSRGSEAGALGNVRAPEQRFPNPRSGRGRGAEDAAGAERRNVWQKRFTRLATGLAWLALVIVIAVPILKEARVARAYRRAEDPIALSEAAFAQFASDARELAAPWVPSESATSYARRLERTGKVPAPEALSLARIYEAARYGPRGVGEREASDARALARTLRRAMWSSATWPARATRLFSPRTLLPGA